MARLTVRFVPSGRLFGLVFGLLFAGFGTAFLLSSVPHTEVLQCELGEGTLRWSSYQRIAGVLTVSRGTLETSPRARAAIEVTESDGSNSYHVFIEGKDRRLHFGKAKSDFGDAQAVMEKINSNLSGPDVGEFTYEEDVWWWFMAPFGLVGILIGVFVIGLLHHRNTWTFDRTTGEITHRASFWVPLRTRTMPLSDATAAGVEERPGSDGDIFSHLVLHKRTGERIDMTTVAEVRRVSRDLTEAAEKITSFLRFA